MRATFALASACDLPGFALLIADNGTISVRAGKSDVGKGAPKLQPVPPNPQKPPKHETPFWTSPCGGVAFYFDRQRRARFIGLLSNYQAVSLEQLPDDDIDAFWNASREFLAHLQQQHQLVYTHISLSHGTWMRSKHVHLKIEFPEAEYVALHDANCSEKFASKQTKDERNASSAK
eukprot:TRINITY_DN68142_c4_g1_i1.p1 TRINITY_DN68142_c4_g1~~TRINITY_DN68142_c4_g1_i1.p1  ORF type:complete len:176 (-),score=21.59 TRINITY_DN68142_c4_g1_i1:102-629(-)